MKNNNSLMALFFGCLLILTNTSCEHGNAKQKPENTIALDSVLNARKDSLQAEIKNRLPVHPVYDDEAKYIAGMKVSNSKIIDSSLTRNKSWKEYAANLDKSWKKTDTSKIQKMRAWSETELNDATTKTVFYPFSGADFFNVYTLFPKAESYIMVGLEPVGTFPNFHKGTPPDSISGYFRKVNNSLFAILNFSFFKTHNMSIDFNDKELNGTIHLIVLFIERTGNSIIDVKPAGIDGNGNIYNYKSFKEERNAAGTNRGIEVDFVNSGNELKKVYYFSVNLDNSHLNKNPDFVKMVSNAKSFTTYIKSASYLMHKDVFSTVRNMILDNSNYILQDDSGIPYKYFKQDVWNTTLYGSYTGSIPLFTSVFQDDLDAAFKAKSGVKPLKFGIGYKYREGESNLMYYRRK